MEVVPLTGRITSFASVRVRRAGVIAHTVPRELREFFHVTVAKGSILIHRRAGGSGRVPRQQFQRASIKSWATSRNLPRCLYRSAHQLDKVNQIVAPVPWRKIFRPAEDLSKVFEATSLSGDQKCRITTILRRGAISAKPVPLPDPNGVVASTGETLTPRSQLRPTWSNLILTDHGSHVDDL